MRQGRGYPLSKDQILRVLRLLRTDMDTSEICERLHCSQSLVLRINREYQVRLYESRRSSWTLKEAAK